MWMLMTSMNMFVSFMSVLSMVGSGNVIMTLGLSKDHFDITYLCIRGIHGVADDVYGEVWVIHPSAIHGGVLEMAS